VEYSLIPSARSSVKRLRLTARLEIPTIANLMNIFKLRSRIHHALRTNSTISRRPSRDSPREPLHEFHGYFLDARPLCLGGVKEYHLKGVSLNP